jgi:hypothetical protein
VAPKPLLAYDLQRSSPIGCMLYCLQAFSIPTKIHDAKSLQSLYLDLKTENSCPLWSQGRPFNSYLHHGSAISSGVAKTL